MKRIYLASPYGFSSQQRTTLLPVFVEILSQMGAEVDEPLAGNQQVKFAAEKGWAYQISAKEISKAYGAVTAFSRSSMALPLTKASWSSWGRPLPSAKRPSLFRDDFRRSADCEDYPLNLMLFTGLPEEGWRDYVYASVEEIPSPEKALVRWLEGRLT